MNGQSRSAAARESTRREFLGVAASVALGAVPYPSARDFGSTRWRSADGAPASAPTSHPALHPWWMDQGEPSVVIEARSPSVVRGVNVDDAILEDMLTTALARLTGQKSLRDAWGRLLGDARRVAIKFNSVGEPVIGTTTPMARLLVQSLRDAGVPEHHVCLVEAPGLVASALRTGQLPVGWGPPVAVGDGAEQLAAWLYDVDAVINVGFLKVHQIAGMSGAMINLSHALLRRPARYHGNGCSPFVGQVIGSENVASRVKLNIINALRIVVDRGPEAGPDDVSARGSLLASFDPVALDAIGWAILAQERKSRNLSHDFKVPYITSAQVLGVGRARTSEIQRIDETLP